MKDKPEADEPDALEAYVEDSIKESKSDLEYYDIQIEKYSKKKATAELTMKLLLEHKERNKASQLPEEELTLKKLEEHNQDKS